MGTMPEDSTATGSRERSEVMDSNVPEQLSLTDATAMLDLSGLDEADDNSLLQMLEQESKTEEEFKQTFQFVRSVGRGSFSKVAVAKDGQGCEVAVKVIDLKAATLPLIQKLRELRLLRSCHNDNMVSFLGSYVLPGRLLALVTEFLDGGTLEDVVKVAAVRFLLQEDVIGAVCKALLKALVYLHDRDVIHRDVKPDNVLLSTGGDVKLCDFGFCELQGRSPCSQRVGTPWYMAPEVARRQGLYSSKVDVWGLGIIVMVMVTGEAPYSDWDPTKTMNSIATKGVPHLPPDKRVTVLVNSFAMSCLHTNPDLRPRSRDLLDHALVDKVAPPAKVGHVVRYRQVIAPSVEDEEKWWENIAEHVSD